MGHDVVGVVGAGVMGSEIAYVAAVAGRRVVLRDLTDDLVGRGLAHVREVADGAVRRGRMTEDEAAAVLGRITGTTEEADLAACGLVVEAVSEVMDLKLRIFRSLDAALPPETVLATNTSGLSVTELGRATGRPGRVLGLHFFNPASVMRLVEVIEGEDTDGGVLADAEALVRDLGKTPVRVRECPGFLVNRMLVRAMATAYRTAAASGADPAAVDAAVVESGPAPMGPFALGDLVGLDTLAHIRRDLEEAYGDRYADAGRLDALVAEGRLGRKSGGGFFAGRAPEAVPDAPAREAAAAYYAAALDEARRCLAEGIAAGESDVDLAMRLGAGWSAGPLAAAREQEEHQ
jgi:3-hydroxybutyryl-CoA dehydrogenase